MGQGIPHGDSALGAILLAGTAVPALVTIANDELFRSFISRQAIHGTDLRAEAAGYAVIAVNDGGHTPSPFILSFTYFGHYLSVFTNVDFEKDPPPESGGSFSCSEGQRGETIYAP